jgi:hypothetical protein
MRLRLSVCLLLAVMIVTASSATSAYTTRVETQIIPELKAYRINPHPPTIDGMLDDSVWSSPNIQRGRMTIQRNPTEGTPVSESTLVAIAYDDQALYAAFWCFDSEPEKIDRQLVRRDRTSQSDRVTLRIDPFHDHQNGYAFELNASSVERDCRYYNENNADMDWDAVWESAARLQPWGWSAELRIPYNCLRFPEKEEHTWGLDFVRYINRKSESDGWAFTPSSKGGFVSNFGHLTGLINIKPASHLELLPYMVSSEQVEPKSLGNPDGRSLMKNAGLDLKYGISSDLVLDAAINPDFGQVELDQPVLNLSTYETFYSERRPFFLEGADLYQTDFNLFYSRRIGRPPRGSVSDPEFAYYKNFPKSTTILGAAKLTGKLFERTSVALLTAVTQREKAEYIAETDIRLDSTWVGDTLHTSVKSVDEVTRKGVVEPEASYSVLRIKRELFRNSSIGGMLTLASQDSRLPATTGGVDWRLSTNDNAWGVCGQVIFSQLNDGHTGYGFDLELDKNGGKHIRGSVGGTIKDRFLNLNRLGYSSRGDSRSAYGWIQYRTTDPWWIFQETYNNINVYPNWNFDGVNYQLGANFNTNITFTNYWYLGGGVEVQGEKYSDVETRGNGLWEWPKRPTFSWWASLTTDQRKKLWFNWNPGSGQDRGGTWWASYQGFGLRPRSNMEFSAGFNYKRERNGTRWVGSEGETSIFADLDRNEVFFDASASIVVNRDLSIQLSAQGLGTGLDYTRYRYYLGGNTYSEPFAGPNSDYNYSEMNSTLLIRWEYRPGSTLYLVWTRSRPEFDQTANNLDVSRDLKRMFSGEAENIFLVKASYWMSM